jgi:endoglucanase
MKFILLSFLILILSINPLVSQSDSLLTIQMEWEAFPVDSIPPDTTGMRNLTSVELAKGMPPGWNVGNSLEAIGGETAWGNPLISQRLIDSVKAAGFNSIRIPVAWSKFTDDSLFRIELSWLNRVEEVVNYILNNNMYAVINEHWDGGWQQPTYAQQDYVNNRLAAMWKQIAIHFRDYDDRLLFAGTNEVMVTNDYGTPTVEYYTVQNSFNQTFVTTVRSTGGRNQYRHLIVQGFNTNINNTVNFFVIPQDIISHKLIVEVHYYDPYNFTLNENSNITQWGKNATDPAKTETWANEAYADGQFQKMKTDFIDEGYAVILGEYGVISRLDLGSEENAEHAGFRKYYLEYITESIFRHGLVPFYWDNGHSGNHGFAIFNRLTGERLYPELANAIINAIDTTIVSDLDGEIPVKPEYLRLMQNYPNPFNPQTIIKYNLPVMSDVGINVYNVKGELIKNLVNKWQQAGEYSVEFDGTHLASGIYFYRLKTNSHTLVKQMLLIK